MNDLSAALLVAMTAFLLTLGMFRMWGRSSELAWALSAVVIFAGVTTLAIRHWSVG